MRSRLALARCEANIMYRRRALLVAAIIGGVAATAAATVSVLRSIGQTPPWLALDSSRWTNLDRFGVVPEEFFPLALFVGAAALICLWPRERPSLIPVLILVAAISILVQTLEPLFSNSEWTYPEVGMTTAALLLLGLSVSDRRPGGQSAMETLRGDWSAAKRSPDTALLIVASVGIIVSIGVTALTAIKTTSPGTAVAADLRRWYLSQAREPNGPGGVNVEAYIDFSWRPRASNFVQQEGLLNAYRHLGLPVTLRVLTFPREAECHGPTANATMPPSCEAAYAFKLIESSQGQEAAIRFLTWSISRMTVFNSGLVREQVQAFGLSEEFVRQRATLHRAVLDDIAMARARNVSLAPAFVVQGVRVPQIPGGPLRVLQFEAELHGVRPRATPGLAQAWSQR